MKRIITLLIGSALLLLTLISALAIRINEIMYNPEGDDNNKEWVELYSEDEEIDLSNWTIGDNSSNDTLLLLKYDNSNYILIVEDEFNYSSIPAKIYSAGATIGNGLGNIGDSIYIYDKNKTLIDYVSYNNSYANGNKKSLEFFNGSFYESIVDNGTPGKENSILAFLSSQTNSSNLTNISNTTQSVENELCDVSISLKTEKDVYDNREPIKFKHILSNSSFTFKIEYWIEDLFGSIVKAKRTTENLNEKSYTPRIDEKEKALIIKSILHVDCDENESNNAAEKLVLVRNNDFEEESKENLAIPKFEYEVIGYPEKIISGKEFSVLVRIKSDNEPHLISLTSYIYKYSIHYSNESYEEFTLDKNEETVVELKNKAIAPPGEYKLKVKIRKDSLKTTYEITKNTTIIEETNDSGVNGSFIKDATGMNLEQNTSKESNSISNEENETVEHLESKTIVYKSKGAAAREWIKYVIIGFLTLISIILVWRR